MAYKFLIEENKILAFFLKLLKILKHRKEVKPLEKIYMIWLQGQESKLWIM